MERDLPAKIERLHEHHRRMTEDLARIAEHAAEIHDQAADVHEHLAEPRLEPEALRGHAQRDRDLAAKERARLEEF